MAKGVEGFRPGITNVESTGNPAADRSLERIGALTSSIEHTLGELRSGMRIKKNAGVDTFTPLTRRQVKGRFNRVVALSVRLDEEILVARREIKPVASEQMTPEELLVLAVAASTKAYLVVNNNHSR